MLDLSFQFVRFPKKEIVKIFENKFKQINSYQLRHKVLFLKFTKIRNKLVLKMRYWNFQKYWEYTKTTAVAFIKFSQKLLLIIF